VIKTGSEDGSGVQLQLVAGRMDVLGLDSANVTEDEDAADVLGLVALGGSSGAEVASLA